MFSVNVSAISARLRFCTARGDGEVASKAGLGMLGVAPYGTLTPLPNDRFF